MTEEIIKELTDRGLQTHVETFGIFDEILVTIPERNVRFIVTNDFAPTPKEAARRAEIISARFELTRTGANSMVIAADMWKRGREMTLARMLAHCGIFTRVFARNCEVRRVTRPVAAAFLTGCHSYGAASCRYCYGLFTLRGTPSRPDIPAGALVAVAEFSAARKISVGGHTVRSCEWIRYASLPEVRVEGGMGKVLKKFIGDARPDDIMSYADLEWSDGGVYRSLGFRPVGIKSPVLFTIDPLTHARIPVLGSRKAATQAQARSAMPTPADTDPRATAETSTRAATQARTQDIPRLYYQNFGSIKYRLTVTGAEQDR